MSGGILTGIYRKRKHPSENGGGGGGTQTRLSNGVSYISRSDAKDYLIPVLKEIGKAVFPAAAPVIEAAYQAYKHYDAIREGGSAILKGDYETAAKVALKEVGKEAGGAILGAAAYQEVDRGTEIGAGTVSTDLPHNDQGKDLVENIVKGTIKGSAEAVEDKIIDKVADKVTQDEKCGKKVEAH
jgi:hypothetical protein